jgi:hypothetical protein
VCRRYLVATCAVVLTVSVVLTACGGSASPPRVTPTVDAASQSAPGQAAAIARCKPASQNVVTDVAGGLKKPAKSLADSVIVATSASERATGEMASVILAARVVGGGDAIGTWAYSGSGIDALNGVAMKYSEWGGAAQPGSPLSKARASVLLYPETRRAALCAATGAGGGASASIGANRCGFPSAPDVIYWFQAPGNLGAAQLLGAYDFGNCTRTADQSEVDKTSPQGSGFCSIVASLSANPGYDVDATPAPRPNGVLAKSGAGC